MEPSDNLEKFLNGVSLSYNQSEITTLLTSCSSEINETLTSDPLCKSIREWLRSQSQSCESDPSACGSDMSACVSDFLTSILSKIEMTNQNKDELRQYLKQPQADNVLRLPFNKHKNFLDMVTSLSEVGNKSDDYSNLVSGKFVSCLKKHVERLEDAEKFIGELQQLSTNTAADIEEIRKKTYKTNT